MKINLTTGIISLVVAVVLTAGGWIVSLAVSGNDQKHLMMEFEKQKTEFSDQKKEFKAHCERQAEDISFIKESLVRIETKLEITKIDRRIGKPVNKE